MTRLRIIPLVLVALLATVGAVRAQVAVGSPALSGWTGGSPLDRRPIVPVSAYSSSAYYPGSYGSLAPPIFMTTLSTPGIYGAYNYGTGGLTLTREPWFYPVYDDRETIPSISITTTPLRRPDTPAGAPTLAAWPPSVTPALPGNATLRTYPYQALAAPAASQSSETTARVVVRVPEYALLEFEGVAMPQTGRVRKFSSPPLVPGQRYRYNVVATWEEDGRTVVRERRIYVYAGEKADIDFLSPQEEKGERELQTRPILPAASPAAPQVVPPGATPRP
jgi:uncharacterized protein (TIGR03000 family)